MYQRRASTSRNDALQRTGRAAFPGETTVLRQSTDIRRGPGDGFGEFHEGRHTRIGAKHGLAAAETTASGDNAKRSASTSAQGAAHALQRRSSLWCCEAHQHPRKTQPIRCTMPQSVAWGAHEQRREGPLCCYRNVVRGMRNASASAPGLVLPLQKRSVRWRCKAPQPMPKA